MATLQERYDEAVAAHHSLLTGQNVVEVRDSDGSLVRYGKADKDALVAYIAALKAEIDALTTGLPAWTGPMRLVF